eukprot:jgi/Bigna1/135334/aug1.29_g10042
MLLASNSWLVRFGVEDYIRIHNVSTRSEEWDDEEEEFSRIWNWKTMHTVIALPLPDGTELPWFHQKHEGSFYPSKIIIDLIEDLEADPQSWNSFFSINAWLEEIIFSTWAMRKLSAEFRNGDGFGIVAFTGGSSRDPGTNFSTPNQILEVLHAYEDVFGIKPINRYLDEEGAKRYIQGELHQNATEAQSWISSNGQHYGKLPNLVFNGKVVR